MERFVRDALVCLTAATAACGGEGTWEVETWGEDYIERQIPADAFVDGCSATYDTFVVSMTRRALVDGNGDTVGEIAPGAVYDVVVPGPTPMGRVTVPADHYDEVLVEIAPGATEVGTASPEDLGGASVLATGTLTCDGASVTFDWSFAESATYRCAPEDLTIPPGGVDSTQVTVHGDHLFYDSLDVDAEVRGREILAADADGDGAVTLEELDAVSIPALGFGVGQNSDVLTLRQFVAAQTRTLVHIDGEGECRVDPL